MSLRRKKSVGPRGGLRAGARALRGWSWNGRAKLVSRPVRCKKDEWYVARVRLANGARMDRATLLMLFLREDRVLGQRCLRMHAPGGADHAGELLGWIETPTDATHLQLCVPDPALTPHFEEIVLHNTSERDPKCHPLANVPRWKTYRTPFSIERVVLPATLKSLAQLLDGVRIEVLEAPASLARLRERTRGAACVLAPEWCRDLGLTLEHLEQLASSSWLVVDLETLARLVSRAGAADAKLVSHAAEHGLMSARVEYADVPTRGFALQDVAPYTAVNDAGRFCQRGIRSSRSWRRYADEVGFATLLSGETPWTRNHADVLSAVRAIGGGELIGTDLPWLVAGRQGELLAPRIATHLLRMHLAQPIKEHLQYWNRWEDGTTVVRDISDLARHYPPLRAERWASADPRLAQLGVTLARPAGLATRHVIFRTGRSDCVDVHDGLAPEPLMIFMKWLAREAREDTPWARRHLARCAVTWQFNINDGIKYAVNYDAAAPPAVSTPEVVHLRTAPNKLAGESGRPARPRSATAHTAAASQQCGAARGPALTITSPHDEGLHGDRSLEFQDWLTKRLRRVIEQGA